MINSCKIINANRMIHIINPKFIFFGKQNLVISSIERTPESTLFLKIVNGIETIVLLFNLISTLYRSIFPIYSFLVVFLSMIS